MISDPNAYSWRRPNAINEAGQVVGIAYNSPPNKTRAVRWNEGRMIRLPGGDSSQASDLNSAGQIVGCTTEGFGTTRAVLWEDGQVIELANLPFCSQCEAAAINESGQIVGTCSAEYGNSYAVLWHEGAIFDLDTLPGHDWSYALGINNHGQIVGWSRNRNLSRSPERPVLWQNGEVIDFATLSDDADSRAVDINDAGQIVGCASIKHPVLDEWSQRAVLWDKGEMIVLPTLTDCQESKAAAINNRGQIVGWCSPRDVVDATDDDAWFSQWQPVLWEKGEVLALGTLLPNGMDGFAIGINDRGQIVGCSEPSMGTDARYSGKMARWPPCATFPMRVAASKMFLQ